MSETVEELKESVNKYLTYAANDWLKENKVAVEHSLKLQLAENFLSGLKTLFEENYVDMPDAKIDLVESITENANELEDQLNGALDKNLELMEELNEVKKDLAITKFSLNMTEAQQEKFKIMTENLDFSDENKFGKQLKVIAETHFKGTNLPKVKVTATGIITEENTVDAPEVDNVIQEEIENDKPKTGLEGVVKYLSQQNRLNKV